MKIIFPESCKKYVELQNATYWNLPGGTEEIYDMYENPREVKQIESLLKELHPKNILELGSGLGRISVYLKNQYKWNDTNLYLLDGEISKTLIAWKEIEI